MAHLNGLDKKLAVAIKHAACAHVDQADKGGEAYILHCIAVMERVRPHGKVAMITAILHDLKEDAPKYSIDLYYFPAEVRAALDCLTRRRDEDYLGDYIERIAGHPVARIVKLADLTHNMDTGRLPLGDIGETDFQRWDKYRRALVRLSREG